MLEVGPGLGSLTLGILDAAKDMVAVEIDPPLAQQLPHTIEKFRPEKAGDIDVVLMDALKVTELPRTPDALVANLPYNVAVPVLLHLFAQFPSIRHALVMVQDEVADRLSATPGSKIYGVPSVKANWYAEVYKAGVIGAFAQRRKTLRAALSSWAGSGARAEQILVAAGIAQTERGEKLDIHGFIRIAEASLTIPAEPVAE